MGKLFVIEGIDGSGKTTQIKRLMKKLSEEGHEAIQLKFPRYENESSALIRMYLGGEFGSHPDDVNAYAASTFFSVDRYASYKQDWGKKYENGAFVVSDRYVTSNFIHQASKLEEKDALAYAEWLFDFEYGKLGLPVPDAVLFLDVPPRVTVKQVEKRYEGDESKKDIHEKDYEYLEKCYKTALLACENGYMKKIDCLDKDGKMKSIDEIGDLILREVEKAF